MSELTPQQLEELSDAVTKLTEVMNNLPSALAGITGKADGLGKAFIAASSNVDKYSQAYQKAEEEKVRKERVVQDAQYAATSALRNFTGALQDTSDNLKKYSSTVSSGFDALSSIAELSGSKFGFALAGMTKVLGIGADQLLAYNSRLVNAYQSLSQFGIGAGITSEEIAKLGRDSNFSGEQLQTFAKVTGQAGADLIALGGTVTEGMRMFGKFTAVGDKVARQLNYLGVSTEQYLEYQQKFLAQEINAGLATGRGEAAMNKLTQASLQLYSEMMKQAELTGASVQQQMEEREYLSSMANYRVYNLKRIQDIQKQEDQLGKEETARRIQTIKDESRIMLENATMLSTQAGRDVATSFLRRASTEGVGVLATEADVAAERFFEAFGGMTGVIRESKVAAEQGLSYTSQMQNMIFDSGSRVIDLLGTYTAFPTEVMEDLRKLYGGTDEVLKFMTRRMLDEGNLTTEQRQNEYNRQREIVEQGYRQRLKEAESISMATDAAMIFATTLYEKERQFRKAIDEGLSTINKPFVTLAIVAIGAIAGIAALAGAAVWAANQIRKAPWGQIPGTGPISGPGKTPPKAPERPDSIILGSDGKPLPSPEPKAPDTTPKPGPGKFGKLGRLGSPLSLIGGIGLGLGADYARDQGSEGLATGLDIAGRTAEFAGAGGLIGSVVPGLGTGIGATAGAAMGLTYGILEAITKQKPAEQQEPPEVDVTVEPAMPNVVVEMPEVKTTAEDITKDMSDNELAAQTRQMMNYIETTGRSNKTAEQSQQLIAAYMQRIASAEEKAEFEKTRENLRRSNNQTGTNEFSLEVTRAFARNRMELTNTTSAFSSEIAATTQSLIDFKSASLQATRNLKDISGISIFEPEPDTDNTIKIDQASIDALGRIIPRAYIPGAERTAPKGGPDLAYRPGFEDLPAEVDAYLRATRDLESGGGEQLRVTAFQNATSIGGQYGLGQSARKEAYANLTAKELQRLQELGIKEAPTLDTLVMPDGKTFREGMEEVDNILAKSYARLTYSALKGKIKDREVTAADMRGAWWHGIETYSRILDESIKNPDMLVSEFYRQQSATARAAGKNYVMPDPAQFKGRTIKQQLDYIAKQVATVEQYKKELPDRLPTDVDVFGNKPNTNPFALENVGQNIRTYNERRNAELGIPNLGNILGNNAPSILGPNATPATSSLVVSTNKDMPLITVDPTTNINMTSLIDLNKIQTSELTALNSKIGELNTKIDTLNDTQRKLLERSSA